MTDRWGFGDTVMPTGPAIAEIGLSSITYFDYYSCVTYGGRRPRSRSAVSSETSNSHRLRFVTSRKNRHMNSLERYKKERVHPGFFDFEKIDDIGIDTAC